MIFYHLLSYLVKSCRQNLHKWALSVYKRQIILDDFSSEDMQEHGLSGIYSSKNEQKR